MRVIGLGLAGILAAGIGGAAAADLGTVKQPDGTIAPPADWIGLEVSPSFYATNSGGHVAGHYDDTSVKLIYQHRFNSAFALGGSFKDDIKQDGKHQFYAETKGSYRFDFGRFSLTPSAALGVTWSDTGFGPPGDATAAYYAFYLAGDLALTDKLDWNVFDLRYRDAFDYAWDTPEVTTGLTYKMTDADRVYGNASYSWKGTGDGLHGDTYSFAVGVEHGF